MTLTLDANICAVAYEALGGRNGTIGVYNYETGDIICMVSAPTYDPADPPSSPEEGSYINRFTSSTFVPGSVFKLVTAAAAIENLDDAYTWEINCTGSVSYGGQYAVTTNRPTGPWIWKQRGKSPVTAILASWPKSWDRGSWKNTWKRPD